MSAEQRKEARAAIEARFSARDANGAGTLTFTSGDVSTGGAFLKSDWLLEPGEVLTLSFIVPGAGPIEAEGRVAWVRRFPEAGQHAGMGVEFTSIRSDDRQALGRWLSR